MYNEINMKILWSKLSELFVIGGDFNEMRGILMKFRLGSKKSNRYVSKSRKMLSLCITLTLVNGGITAFAADNTATVNGTLNGTAITGSTNFNQITVIDNSSAVVKDKDGNVTTITNSKAGGWDTIMGANDRNDNTLVYESVGGNIINVAGNDVITIHNLIGGSST